MKRLIVLAIGVSAATAFAQTPPALSPTGAGSGDLNPIVCRTVRETGSRLRLRRVCMTRAEWALRRSEHRRGAELLQMRRHSATF